MRSSRDFFIGVLTGATIGLLTAPRTGRESRQWLKSEYDKRTQGASGSSDGPGLKERLMSLYEQAKAQVDNYMEQRKNHQERLKDTGHFDYQRDRERQFASQTPNSAEALSSGTSGSLSGSTLSSNYGSSSTSGLTDHNAQIIRE